MTGHTSLGKAAFETEKVPVARMGQDHHCASQPCETKQLPC